MATPEIRDSPRLFPELIDIILDFAHEDACTMATCSLVCKDWLATSRYHFFQRGLRISHTSWSASNGYSDLQMLWVSPHHTFRYCTALHLTFPEHAVYPTHIALKLNSVYFPWLQGALPCIAQEVPDICELTLNRPVPEMMNSKGVAFIIKTFRGIASFHLHDPLDLQTLNDLGHFLTSFTELRHLSLSNITAQDTLKKTPTSANYVPLTFSRPLESLKIVAYNAPQCAELICYLLHSPAMLSCITTLAISMVQLWMPSLHPTRRKGINCHTEIDQLLRLTGCSVKHLTIAIPSDRNLQSDALANSSLQNNTALLSLDLSELKLREGEPDTYRPLLETHLPRFLTSIPTSTTKPSRRVFSTQISFTRAEQLQECDWRPLDDALMVFASASSSPPSSFPTSSFSSKEPVPSSTLHVIVDCFHLSVLAERWDTADRNRCLRHIFPQCAARGILSYQAEHDLDAISEGLKWLFAQSN